MDSHFAVFEPANQCAHGFSDPASLINAMISDTGNIYRHNLRHLSFSPIVPMVDSKFKNIVILGKHETLKQLDKYYETLRDNIDYGLLTYQEGRSQFVRLQLKVEPHKMARIGNIQIVTIPHRCLRATMFEESEDVVAISDKDTLTELLEMCEPIKNQVDSPLDLAVNAAHIVNSMRDVSH